MTVHVFGSCICSYSVLISMHFLIHNNDMTCKVTIQMCLFVCCVRGCLESYHDNPHSPQVKTFQHTIFQLACSSVHQDLKADFHK